jgi:DNA-binding transcriptional ArsR family regulator
MLLSRTPVRKTFQIIVASGWVMAGHDTRESIPCLPQFIHSIPRPLGAPLRLGDDVASHPATGTHMAKQRYTDEERAEGDWFFALSDPPRLRILRALIGGSKSLKELAAACHVHQQNVSRHVNILERAGFITSVKENQYRHCTLAKDAKVTKDAIEFAHPSGRKAVVRLR